MMSKKKRNLLTVASLVLILSALFGCVRVAEKIPANTQETTASTTQSPASTTVETTSTATETTTAQIDEATTERTTTTTKKTTTTMKTTATTIPTTTQVFNPDREAYLNEIKGNKKLIAFTFDDGPTNNYTNKLLSSLDKYNARVTFFVVGDRVSKYSKTLKRAYDMGNEIGSHTYNHKNLAELKPEELEKQIEKTNQAVKSVIGVTPGLMRPPYGSYDDKVKTAAKVPVIMWSLDTLDWKNRDKNKICENIVKNAHDGSIVLMHDLYETTVDGAIMAMDKLQHEGYAFVTVSELAQLKGKTLEPGKVYNIIK